MRYPCRIPPSLRPGDRVALVSPSYHAPMENVTAAADVLRDWGFEPVLGRHVGKVHAGQYAGTLEQRAEDLRWALTDPSIRAVLCNRGGYGTLRLPECFRAADFAASPKWLIGFSDITTLLEMENAAGVAAIHGPMCSQLAKSGGKDAGSLLLRDLLTGRVPRYELPAHPLNRPGSVRGRLVGGNLCTLAPNLGSWADVTRGRGLILFLEEVGETMHNVDRQLNILRHRGVLDRCRGVVLGQFTGCDAEFDYGSVEAMLMTYLEGYGIPVLCGFPAGHGEPNLPLVMGVQASLEVRADGATLAFDMPGEVVSLP